jgi:hypothetical protein
VHVAIFMGAPVRGAGADYDTRAVAAVEKIHVANPLVVCAAFHRPG